MSNLIMLDTNICSYVMKQHPIHVLKRLEQAVMQRKQIVISAITYQELRFGSIGKKAKPQHSHMVDAFIQRIHNIMPYDKAAVEAATQIRKNLAAAGQPIGLNDTLIAGHALALNCLLVTNNEREFNRVPHLTVENWVNT